VVDAHRILLVCWVTERATYAVFGIAQQCAHRAILDVMRDEIDALLEMSDPAFVQSLFEGFAQSAMVSNMKRIAKHPHCPQAV